MIEQTECAICLQSLSELETSELNCKHIFHTECVCLLKKLDCPCCRGEITSPEIVVENIKKNMNQNTYFLSSILTISIFPQVVIDVYNFIHGLEPSENNYLVFEGDYRESTLSLPLNFNYELGRDLRTDFLFACSEYDDAQVSNDQNVQRTFTISINGVPIHSQNYTVRDFIETVNIIIAEFESSNNEDSDNESDFETVFAEMRTPPSRSRSPSPDSSSSDS